ncbi:four helix bundle protein [bacterium]|nr:four helix bundle protein [bacterium]
MQNNQRVRVWKEARKLATDVHRFADSLPQQKSTELQRQMRQAATCLHQKLDEDSSRNDGNVSGKSIAESMDSLSELEKLYYLSSKMGYVNTVTIEPTLARLGHVKKQVFELRKVLVAKK